jgi:diguanylate cyclase (GGDEF)-like protein
MEPQTEAAREVEAQATLVTSENGETARHGPLLTLLRVAGFVALGVYALHSVAVAGDDARTSATDWLFAALVLVGALSCLARAAFVRAQRTPWVIAGVGLLSWFAGEVLFALEPRGGGPLSPADLLSLAFYPALGLSLILLLREAVPRFAAILWLDGLAGALAVSGVLAGYAFPPVLADSGRDLATVAGNISYPLADLLVVAAVLFTVAMTGWRPGRVLGLVCGALLLVAAADSFALWWSAAGHSSSRTALDWLWPAAAVLLVEAAWRPPLRRMNFSATSGLRSLAFPILFSVMAVALLVSGLLGTLNAAGYELATSALAILVVRMVLTAVENLRMTAASRREALTDALTGLGNRRSLMLDLEDVLRTATPGNPTLLMLLDLDGFKRYNDTFGHPAGDALLHRLGRALAAAVADVGRPYRLGGDEFCVLFRARAADIAELIPVTVESLSEHGKGFSVVPSFGSIVVPNEATDVTLALQLADQRMYERKSRRKSVRESEQTRDVLMQVLRERQPDLSDHLGGVAAMARDTALQLGLSAEEIDQVTRGAELHDIGKMAVPEAILEKPGALDEYETKLIRQHTVIGERILAAAPALRPVGRLVRASHERYDGSGYPDGLAGDEIPLGARIVAVCDAFEAMTTGRPYQPAISVEQAVTELRQCAGRQFDPRVVEIFCEKVLASRRELERAGRAA